MYIVTFRPGSKRTSVIKNRTYLWFQRKKAQICPAFCATVKEKAKEFEEGYKLLLDIWCYD